MKFFAWERCVALSVQLIGGAANFQVPPLQEKIMKKRSTLMAVTLFFSASAWAQSQAPVMPAPGSKPAIPSAPSKGTQPPADAASGSGMVVVPPDTGTESIKIPPNVDPEITKPTEEIDRKNRQKSEDLKKPPFNKQQS